MMVVTDKKIIDNIEVGDLVFIWHRAKPTKTGWWRYIENESDKVLVLEKPMHKDFKENDPIFRNSRKVNGHFVMSKYTLKSSTWADNYNALFLVKGILTVELVNNNYSITAPNVYNKLPSIYYTQNGYELIQELSRRDISEIKKLAQNLI